MSMYEDHTEPGSFEAAIWARISRSPAFLADGSLQEKVRGCKVIGAEAGAQWAIPRPPGGSSFTLYLAGEDGRIMPEALDVYLDAGGQYMRGQLRPMSGPAAGSDHSNDQRGAHA